MLVIPAIDLLDKKVVRLIKGREDSAKIYSDKPIDVVRAFKKEGAKFFHIVDLSSAFDKKDNLNTIEEIFKKTKIKAEVGGGIRSIEKAKKILDLGATRIVVGTKSLDKAFLKNLCKTFGAKKIVVGVDVRNNKIAIFGWKKQTLIDAFDFIKELEELKIKWIVYTDILQDGTLKGVNIEKIKRLSVFKNLNIIISGGIGSLEDLAKIKKYAPFVWGVIVGKAFYEKKFTFKEAKTLLL